jgi:hypothetical protein
MNKVILSIILTAVLVFAIPGIPKPVVITLPDNSKITIRVIGDENRHFLRTLDGYTLLYNDKGFLEYAILDENGLLKLSGVRAHDIRKRTKAEKKFLKKLPKELEYKDK